MPDDIGPPPQAAAEIAAPASAAGAASGARRKRLFSILGGVILVLALIWGAYWLLVGQRSAVRPEVKAFSEWLRLEAAATRRTIGEVPDPDLNDNLD